MGAYRYRLCGPSSIIGAELDGETVAVVPARFAFKPWGDERFNRKLWNESCKPAMAAWARTSVARPRYYVILGDMDVQGRAKPAEGNEVRTLPRSFNGISWLDEPDGHIGAHVGYLHKIRKDHTTVWAIRRYKPNKE